MSSFEVIALKAHAYNGGARRPGQRFQITSRRDLDLLRRLGFVRESPLEAPAIVEVLPPIFGMALPPPEQVIPDEFPSAVSPAKRESEDSADQPPADFEVVEGHKASAAGPVVEPKSGAGDAAPSARPRRARRSDASAAE